MNRINNLAYIVIATVLLSLNLMAFSAIETNEELNTEESTYCHTLEWEMEFIGTGFGCEQSSAWCNDIIDDVNCIVYRTTGDDLIIVTPE